MPKYKPPFPAGIARQKAEKDLPQLWSSCYLTARSDSNSIKASKRLTRRRISNPMWISRERRIYRKRLRHHKATQGNMLRSRLYDAVTLLRHCDSNRLTLLSTFVDCVPVNLFNSSLQQEWVDTPKHLWRTGIASGWRGWGDPTKGMRTLCVVG
jgi:hypothetical protein